MRNYKTGIFLCLSLTVILTACNKKTAGTSATTKPILELSKSVVKIGEPVMVTTKGQAAGSAVHWSASPTARIWASPSGDSATFLFTSPGNYQVGATYGNGADAPAYDSTNSSLTVSDSLYTDTTQAQCNSMRTLPLSSDDQILITPLYFSDSAGLVLLVNTKDRYESSPTLLFTGNFTGTGGTYEADFGSLVEFSSCSGYFPPGPATGDVFFNSLTNGTYNLVFKFNGTTYQGSVTASEAGCTFNWNYSSGVTISPLTLSRL